ncbi:MAG: hypothetical protein V1926_04600 [Candidatus Peregrinibacteria bacterium]
MQIPTLRTVAATFTLSALLIPQGSFAYSALLFTQGEDVSIEVPTPPDSRTQCMEKLQYTEVMLESSTNLYFLRRCLSDLSKVNDTTKTVERQQKSASDLQKNVVLPYSQNLLKQSERYLSRSLKAQVKLREASTAFRTQTWSIRDAEFRSVRSAKRRNTRAAEQAISAAEKLSAQQKQDAEHACRNVPTKDRLTCINDKLDEMRNTVSK